MALTVNGVGTMYYGRRNLEKRPGVCEHCGRKTTLASYDRRLWFVILFIPIIPLKHEHIIDECPHCHHGRTCPVGKWRQLSEKAIQEGMEHVRANPDDPKPAAELLGALAAFGRRQDAAKLAALMGEQFADDVKVQLSLGAWHEEEGRDAEANACFERAFELAPEDKAARRAVGILRMEQGRLDEARELLGFLEKPGPEQDAAVVLPLAGAYQRAGRHEEALALFRGALEGSPPLARDKDLRRAVQASEKALGRTETVLPPKPVSRRWLVWTGAAAALVAGLFVVNRVVAGSRQLHVVNGYGAPISVRIDGDEPVQVAPLSRRVVPLGEGSHRALVEREGAAEEAIEFRMRSGFLGGLFAKPVYVLNPGGAAAILWEQIVYSASPSPQDQGSYDILFGQNFYTFRNIDYAFREFPSTLQSESSHVRKSRVVLFETPPTFTLRVMPEHIHADRRLAFLEIHLSASSGDTGLLDAYMGLAVEHDRLARGCDFLRRGLARRPVQVEWHRIYQRLCVLAGRGDDLAAEYDGLLAKDPENAALLYLRGRVEPDRRASFGYYDRAIAREKASPYPYLGKAGYHMASGEFTRARPLYAEAHRLAPEDSDIEEDFFDVRFALGEFEALEREVRGKLKKTPLRLDCHRQLLALCGARSDAKAIQQAHDAYAKAVRGVFPDGDPYQLVLYALLARQYTEKDFDGLLKTARDLKDASVTQAFLFRANLEKGRLKAADGLLERLPRTWQRYYALIMSLAWKEGGDAGAAEKWRRRALDAFAATGSPGEKRLAALLRAPRGELPMDEIRERYPTGWIKACFLLALAERYPERRGELLDLAERLNFAPSFPHHFLKRTIGAMRR